MKLARIVSALSLVAVAAAPARAQLTGRTLTWQYWAFGSPETTGGSPTTFAGGGCGGTYAAIPNVPYFSICTTINTITFQYLTTDAWSSSGPSHGIIHNGIDIAYSDGGPNNIFTLAVDPSTNMAGFGPANIALVNNNEIQVDWTNLRFTPNTVVKLDLNPTTAPEPASLALVATGLVSVFGVVRWRRAALT